MRIALTMEALKAITVSFFSHIHYFLLNAHEKSGFNGNKNLKSETFLQPFKPVKSKAKTNTMTGLERSELCTKY